MYLNSQPHRLQSIIPTPPSSQFSRVLNLISMASTPEPSLVTSHHSRHLMVDLFICKPKECEPKGDDASTSKDEASLKLHLRFEKLTRYVKFYIKAKQKEVYNTPRERESHRLELISEVLKF